MLALHHTVADDKPQGASAPRTGKASSRGYNNTSCNACSTLPGSLFKHSDVCPSCTWRRRAAAAPGHARRPPPDSGPLRAAAPLPLARCAASWMQCPRQSPAQLELCMLPSQALCPKRADQGGTSVDWCYVSYCCGGLQPRSVRSRGWTDAV